MTNKMLQYTVVCALLALGGGNAYADEPALPKVELLGQEYYRYEVKKGDSVYGIAKQYGWDPQELARLNPGATQHLTKGAALYYPTGRTIEAPATDTFGQNHATPADAPVQPVRHLVKKGETAYGIAKQYNISLDELYASHPSARYGVKAGETIVIQYPSSKSDYEYYTVKPGDTLFALAKTYGTTVERIMASNPGVSEHNFKIGDTVRVPVGQTDLVATSNSPTRQDTASPMTSVQMSSPGNTESNNPVNIPGTNETAENTAIMTQPEVEEEQHVRVMLLVDDSTSKRDSEFVKGFLLALEDYKDKSYKVSLAIEKGNDKVEALRKLNEFEPSVVISTNDKNFPGWLADYGKNTGTEIVNVFDVKSEAYIDNPDMMQVLTPSQHFNEAIARESARRFGGRTLIMLGIPDTQDAMATSLREAMGGIQLELTNNDMAHYPLVDTEKYLVYVYPTAATEVEKSLEAIAQARRVSPVAEVSVMGRPNWVTFTETLGEKMGEADVYFPSRFYFDTASPEGKDFTEKFTEQYGHAPVKSYPLYSAMGYDIANYFIPAVAATGGDFTLSVPNASSIQAEVRMKRPDTGSGAYNPVCYLVRMTPYGTVEKITVK